MTEAADALGIPRPAFVALCDHFGVLNLRSYDGAQQRRLVSPEAERAGLGRNIVPMGFLARRKGPVRGSPFALFKADRLDDLGWMFGWPGIVADTKAHACREDRRDFLLTHHGYLPDCIIADLSGYARSAVQKERNARASRDDRQSVPLANPACLPARTTGDAASYARAAVRDARRTLMSTAPQRNPQGTTR